jgi:2,4-diketo-3-deoxy-L-fuconate hydrolase
LEVELVVVIGRRARRVPGADAWSHVAGLTIGQDLSEREIQFRPSNVPQFTLGKSLPRFGPIGPALVTADAFEDPNDLELGCSINGEEKQRGRTSDFIFSIAELIEYLSAATVLYPGDVIMTGTPSGIGSSRTPPEFLRPGDVIESWVDGIGRMRHTVVADSTKEERADGVQRRGDEHREPASRR